MSGRKRNLFPSMKGHHILRTQLMPYFTMHLTTQCTCRHKQELLLPNRVLYWTSITRALKSSLQKKKNPPPVTKPDRNNYQEGNPNVTNLTYLRLPPNALTTKEIVTTQNSMLPTIAPTVPPHRGPNAATAIRQGLIDRQAN